MKKILILAMTALLVISCKAPKTGGQKAESTGAPTYSLHEIWQTDTILRTCESVLYDQAGGLLYVSCINGTPSEKNGAGYIAVLGKDGAVKSLDWVTGLDAPKGMGMLDGKLFVTDIDRIVIIDIEHAEILERMLLPGASFLNDIAVGADGKIYVSDSDTGWIWIYQDGKAAPWITEGLDRPNGLFVEESRVLLTSSGSSDLKVIDKSTGTFETVCTGIGAGDGLEFTGEEGHYLVTSWAGEVFMVFPDFSKLTLLETSIQEINSADIGFNREDQVVYVPTFYANRVVAYRLVKAE
jgi:hypothetical protein